jgi:hypothetical protein
LKITLSKKRVEEGIEDNTIQEAIPTEPTADALAEEVSVQDMANENVGSGEFHPEPELASQGPVSEMDELEEIEQMLNEEYPLIEGGLMDRRMNEVELEEAAIEADSDTQASVNTEGIDPEFMDKHPVDEQHLLDEGISQDQLIEPSVDAQAPESAMDMPEAMPSEPAIEEQPTEIPSMDEQAMMGEKHLMDENMGQSHPIEPSVDAQAPEGAMDMSEAMPSEPAIEEQPTDAHPTDEHAKNEHANDHAMETEAELDPHHL